VAADEAFTAAQAARVAVKGIVILEGNEVILLSSPTLTV
jgi:hypothetical protein